MLNKLGEIIKMNEIKQRDYMFDTFRGFCMWLIPISHFVRMSGGFQLDSFGGVVYIIINTFVMQAFVFLSGYFSKKPDRANQTAFKTFLWPLWLATPFFFIVRYIVYGRAHFYWTTPPFALWFLFALFFYRFFLRNYIKIPHIFAISFIIYLVAGQIPAFAETFALGRCVSYFPFFLIGYYCTKDHLEIVRTLTKIQCYMLGAALLGISIFLGYEIKWSDKFYLLRDPGNYFGMTWYSDIIGRLVIFFLACIWIIFILNILPKNNNFVSYVGRNTMPVYILHLVLRQAIVKYDITFGFFPNNQISRYILVFVFASLCVIILSTKPVSKGYDWVVDNCYNLFILALKFIFSIFGLVEKVMVKLSESVLILFKNSNEEHKSDKEENSKHNTKKK